MLETRRIIVRDIAEDLYDGQVLSELIGQLFKQEMLLLWLLITMQRS